MAGRFLILTYRQSETGFLIHGYISLSGLISFLIVQSFQNSAHPTLQYTYSFEIIMVDSQIN